MFEVDDMVGLVPTLYQTGIHLLKPFIQQLLTITGVSNNTSTTKTTGVSVGKQESYSHN